MSTIKYLYVFICILLVPGWAFAATREVGPGKTYTTIQAAVTAANDDDLIYIYNGTYREAITTAKDLDFEGESKAGVIWTIFEEAVGTPSWSKTGGQDYVYEATASEIVSSGTVFSIIDEDRRGLYLQVASIAAVNDIPGTHYTTGGTLYVRTPDDASPATHTLWYTTLASEDILYMTSSGGQGDISNITFAGATQYGVWIRDTAANIGTVNITNCDFLSCDSGMRVDPNDSTVGGIVNLTSVDILYSIKPVYDVDYPIHTNEDGDGHDAYNGSALVLNYIDDANLDQCTIQFTRNGGYFAYGHEFNATRSLFTDFTVHPWEFQYPAGNDAVFTFENSIFSMHGSTIYVPQSHITSEANDGFEWHFYNNTFYSGENAKLIFSACEDCPATYSDEIKVYWYNNLSTSETRATVSLDSDLTLSNIHMDYNYYSGNADIVSYDNVGYTLSEWQTYTDGQGHSLSDNSTYTASINNVYLEVADEEDTLNPDLGRIQAASPLIDQALDTYAPADDHWGTSRPIGDGDDIGVHEISLFPDILTGTSVSGGTM